MKESKWRSFCKKHWFLAQCLLSLCIGGVIGACFFWYAGAPPSVWDTLGAVALVTLFCAAFLIYPLVLTGDQILLFIRQIQGKSKKRSSLFYDLWTLFLGIFYEIIYLEIVKEVVFTADWTEQLSNYEMHAPLYTGSYLSAGVLLFVFLAGFSVLRVVSVNRMPPLVTVLCMSAVYLGVLFTLVWTVQILESVMDIYLLLPAVNVVCIAMRTVLAKVREFEPDEMRKSKIDEVPFLCRLNRFLTESKRWPYMAFLLMLPLLGVTVLILVLFGQAPNSLIRAFTETSDWNLSRQIAPQNLYYDVHYLCTVAAGGHEKLVKPLRKGVRHGHPVIVNRQLLVANAFEQILEEKVPRIHRAVLSAYDRYGFPLARLIRSKWTADVVWVLMKPLEWLFLAIIYLCDVHPEDRIAVQYTGKHVKEFSIC